MTELVTVKTNSNNEQVVSARELYKELGVKKRFSAWLRQYQEMYVEGEDFTGVLGGTPVKGGNGNVQYLQDYLLAIDMAKNVAMMSKTEKSQQIRDYFIQVEKRYKELTSDPAYQMALGLKASQVLLEQKDQVIAEMKPKVDYYENVIASDETLSVSQISKDYGMSAKEFNKILHKLGIQYKVGNQWVLYSGLTDEGYTKATTGTKSTGGTYTTTKWTNKGKEFIYQTLKDQGILTTEDNRLRINNYMESKTLSEAK